MSVFPVRCRLLLLGISIMAAGTGTSDVLAAEEPRAYERLFSHVGDFSLGPATSRIDYESFDPMSRRLFIAKMGSGTLLVFDTEKTNC